MKQQLDLCVISSEEKYYNSTFELYTEVNVSHAKSRRRVFTSEAIVRSEKVPEVREHILRIARSADSLGVECVCACVGWENTVSSEAER